jgi:hypothetical protein
MKELIKKETWTKEELEQLDDYFYEKYDELMENDNKDIIRFLDICEEVLGYSMTYMTLKFETTSNTIGFSMLFDEENLDEYLKLYELIRYFELEDFELGYTLGDYYKEKGDIEKAIYYYSNLFKEGFDLCHSNYYYALCRYLEIYEGDKIEFLKKLISSSPRDGEYSLDFINTYLQLIINLDKNSSEYLNYINDAIKVATPVVREYQKFTVNRKSFSDSDEERDLCELIALKMEYYVNQAMYKEAMEQYHILTEEIGRSDCTRYYHARDKFYIGMLKSMESDYHELSFFRNLGHQKLKIVEQVDDINNYLNKEITLEKENGEQFKFVINNIYEDWVYLHPNLPLVGKGGNLITDLVIEDGIKYLVNKISH